jgi:hypothetical protein
MKETHREQGIKQKPPSPPPSKRKKLDPSQVQAEHFHWVHETFISKIVCHHFGRDNGMCKPGDMFPINPHSIPYPLP